MSEILTNLPPNLYNSNSSWVDGGGVGGDVVYRDFKWTILIGARGRN
jgi:hypothetical protein